MDLTENKKRRIILDMENDSVKKETVFCKYCTKKCTKNNVVCRKCLKNSSSLGSFK